MKKILLVDDEPEMLQSLKKILSRRSEYVLTLVDDSEAALELVQKDKFDLILTDLKMKNVTGLDILKAALLAFPDSTVIMVSGYGTIDASVEAMREGAFDFIEKPFTSQKLYETVERALSQNFKENQTEEEDEETNEALRGIIYQSTKMEELIQLVKKVAAGNMSVLITGESGTGKELIARAIHSLSKRNLNPFVPVNCGALPEHLFESELFGHERGAFTGAVRTKPGLLEFANTGTFFFDEIGDMSAALQIKLLRMLEDRKIRRVGGQTETEIDVRIIAATNKDLKELVDDKKFREDLYFRLNTIQVHIPALRDRTEDIMPVANYYLSDLSAKNDKAVHRFSSEAEEALLSYPWPGNVRELQNMINRAYFLCSDQVIQRADLPIPMATRSVSFDDKVLNLSYKEAKECLIERFDIEYLSHHLKLHEGNVSKTAEKCGLDRRSIHRLVNKHNIIYKS